MLDALDITTIVDSGEGFNAEFKLRVPNKLRELSQEVCAFANASGGVLMIGVDDNNVIKGAEISNEKRSAIQNAIGEINPHLLCDFYSVDVSGRTVWVIEVPSGERKPYALSGAIFVRQGSNSQKIVSVEQMRDFFQQSDRIYFDDAPCYDFSIENDLDELAFDEFRIDANLSRAVDRMQVIRNLRLLTKDGAMKNGGVLFFGKNPEYFHEKAVVRCVAFEGTNKVHIFDDKVFGGNLVSQYKEAMRWLRGKLNVRYEISAGPRKEHWEIPENALKEALINALSHRDYYDRGARTTVELFDDRVEITNPGGLVSAISEEEFGTKSHSRNPLVFGLFERIDLVEQIGSGVLRIRDEMKEARLKAPVFKKKGMFTVVLLRPVSTQSQQVDIDISSRDIILSLIKENSKISITAMSHKVGINTSAVEKHLTKLKAEGILTRVGTAATGHWELSEFYTQYEGGVKGGVKGGVNSLGENQEMILLALKESPTITIKELANKFGFTTQGIEYHINILKEKGFLRREGSRKTGLWIVTD